MGTQAVRLSSVVAFPVLFKIVIFLPLWVINFVFHFPADNTTIPQYLLTYDLLPQYLLTYDPYRRTMYYYIYMCFLWRTPQYLLTYDFLYRHLDTSIPRYLDTSTPFDL